MNRYALLIEYDGTGYEGFQRQQPHGERKVRAIQEELEKKLSQILVEAVRITAAGRTDTGVHATCQVVTFASHNQRSARDLVRGTNALLDSRVRVLAAAPVEENFHPRFAAEVRTYHYYLKPQQEFPDPFLGRLVWNLYQTLDLESMRQAALPLLGSHDFAAYGRGIPAGEPTRRNMQRIDVKVCEQGVFAPGPFRRLEGLVCIEVCANAFLRRMVRQLVANLIQVGLGNWGVERPAEILRSLDCGQGAAPVPPQGLYLVEVAYAGCNLPAWNLPP
jgi:tRNA pseudouridine38-40 synthase